MPGIIVVGTQWGDEGKGKATDHLGSQVDVVVKFNGGNNAGHTVVVDGQSYALHLLPSGILTPGVTPVIGAGVVVDPEALFAEIDTLESRDVDCSQLAISANAHLIAPYNRYTDNLRESGLGKDKIGTTGRGIGPTYADKMNRIGVRVQDLFDPETLRERVGAALEEKRALLADVDLPGEVEQHFDADEATAWLLAYAERLRPYMVDASLLINDALDAGQTVLFEGGQAALLDIDHGTYPYVTSSSATAGGALTGAGVGPTKIDQVIGVAKAYTTRVGSGPFPTELAGEQGDYLRDLGKEYGVTTGRPRRVGWFDSVLVRYAARVNGLTDIALTKLDILGDYDELPVAVGYRIPGSGADGSGEYVEVTEMPLSQKDFAVAEPIYEVLPGWKTDISQVRSFADLPEEAQRYVEFVEQQVGTRISIIGVGPGRDEVILR